MNPNNLRLKDFIRFLVSVGCKQIRHHDGHIVFTRHDLTRPIVVQDHIDPVPLRVIQSNLRTLGLTLKAIRDFE